MANLELVLDIVTHGHDETAGHLKGIGGAIGGLVEGLGKFGLAGMGLSTISNAFQSLAADAIESEKVMAATNAVLASTKGVSGMTAESVSALATSLSKVTPFEDELIQSTENLLLTFTAIGKDTMPAVTEAALNMATAMGTDPKEAAIQLGKAMQDPITGATALRRVGVALSEQQQEAIKHFMAVGDIASAQAVILKELGTEFGGAAKAAGQTFGGQMKILETQIGNLKEAAFTPLLGVVTDVAKGLTDFATNDAVVGFVGDLANLVSGGLTVAFDVLGKSFTAVQALIAAFTTDAGAMGIVLDQVRKIFGDTVADAIEPFAQAFMAAIPEIKAFVDDVGSGLDVLLFDIQRIFGGPAGDGEGTDALHAFLDDVVLIGQNLVGKLGEWAQAFLSWIRPMIPPLLARLQDLGQQVYGWILETALPALVETLGEWAAAFVDWVVPQIEPLLHTLGELATNMLGWMVDTALPLILSDLLKWGVAFVEWVAPLIPPLLLELGKLLLELGQWALDTALPAIIGHLEKWGTEFVAWVAPQIPPLLVELGALLEQIGAWLLDPALPTIAQKLGQWAGAFVAWVADVVPQIPDALGQILTAIAGWVTGGGLSGVQDQATIVGQGFIQGIIDGVGNLLPNLLKTVGDAATSAIGAFTSGFASGMTGGSGQRGPGGVLSDAQFGQAVRAMGFTENEIASICGPIAAEGVARALGMAVNLKGIVRGAEAAGFGNFSGDVGTYGNPGEQGILKQLGISSQIVGQGVATQLAAAGTPVIINTPHHFFLAQGYDQATGQFDTGATGQVYRGGARNMTLDQITGLGGGLYGFIAPTAQKGGDAGGLRDQMRAYIRNAAAKNGIDPSIADAVFSGESVGYTQFIGDKGSSFGPAQLHLGGLASGGNAGAGLGNTFMQQTGLDPRDWQNNWPQQIDFSLQQAAANGWHAWHAAIAQGITDWQGIGTVAKDFVPTLEENDQGFLDLAATADDSGQTVSDAFDGVVTDAQTFAQKFGISIDAANTIIQDHGQVARTVLGSDIPGSFVLTDQAVERFADTMGVNWDEARAILSEGGRVSELVMGAGGEIPTAASDTVAALTNTGQAHVDLTPKITTVHGALSSLATGGFGAANKAQSEFARDAATQISFVLQQLNDKMPALIGHIQEFTDKLLAIPRDISVNISTSGAVEAAAGAGGGGGGDGSSAGFDLSTSEGRQAARDALGSGFVVTDTGILNQDTGQVVQGFQHGGPVLGPLGAPMSAIVHGGEYVLPAGSWGGGIDYTRLAAAIAAALGVQPIVVQVDGQAIAQVSRTGTARWNQANGSLAAGVGGL